MATVGLTTEWKPAQMDNPLSDSSMTLKLEEIQKRCSELMDNPDSLSELSLEDAATEPDANDPYNHQRV